MSMQLGGSDDDLITEINVTPFVDVVLVLLILFMLAAPVVYQSGVRIQLPTAISASKIKHVTLNFHLAANGDLMLEQQKIPVTSIAEITKKALALDPRSDAMISADKQISHGQVLEVIDALKQGGINDVALGVEPKPTTGKPRSN